ncbi:hypothetical protein [Novipirellula herctigrandis]
MILFVVAFRIGGSLAVLYPIYASTFIWAALIAWFAYDTPITRVHVFGWILLILGMLCMGWTAKNQVSESPSVSTEATINE